MKINQIIDLVNKLCFFAKDDSIEVAIYRMEPSVYPMKVKDKSYLLEINQIKGMKAESYWTGRSPDKKKLIEEAKKKLLELAVYQAVYIKDRYLRKSELWAPLSEEGSIKAAELIEETFLVIKDFDGWSKAFDEYFKHKEWKKNI